MIITSLNLYDFSEKKNKEMGVLIERDNETDVFEAAQKEANLIIKGAEKEFANGGIDARRSTSYLREQLLTRSMAAVCDEKESDFGEVGYCIRCNNPIEFDPTRPYCDTCYRIWAKTKDTKQKENYCHAGGGKYAATMEKPLCRSCWEFFN